MKARRKTKSIAERFWEKVEKTETCWLWTASTCGRASAAYGQFVLWDGERNVPAKAHRVAYELLVGPIPEGLQINHKCEVKLCVNPDHLEVCTQRENLLYSATTLPAKQLARTHCPQGHPYAGENLYFDNGARRCRECRRARFKIINTRRGRRAR